MVALVVCGDPQPILAERVELRSVAEADVELEAQRRFHDDAFHHKWFKPGRGGGDVIRARRQVFQDVLARGGSGGFKDGMRNRVLGEYLIFADGVAARVEKRAVNSAKTGRRCILREGGDRRQAEESKGEAVQVLFCIKAR